MINVNRWMSGPVLSGLISGVPCSFLVFYTFLTSLSVLPLPRPDDACSAWSSGLFNPPCRCQAGIPRLPCRTLCGAGQQPQPRGERLSLSPCSSMICRSDRHLVIKPALMSTSLTRTEDFTHISVYLGWMAAGLTFQREVRWEAKYFQWSLTIYSSFKRIHSETRENII